MAKVAVAPAIRQKIAALCRVAEKEHGIRIIFAVENGSRAWRLSSENSDYDVRFVFARPLADYIAINPQADVISFAFDRNWAKCQVEGSFADFSGFDVVKFARMLSSSNPTTIEWLISDIVYYGKQDEAFRDFAVAHFNPTSLYFHYKSMCRQNYLKYLKSGEEVTYKKYLYAMRGLINARWVVINRSVPPIDFSDAITAMKPHIPKAVAAKLREIILLKAKGKEKDIVQNIVEIDNYIEDFLKDDSEAPREKAYATAREIDIELKRIVLGAKISGGVAKRHGW